jgi:hypothetical protein
MRRGQRLWILLQNEGAFDDINLRRIIEDRMLIAI